MAYVTKVAKDRALWITPSEAVAHVCGIERCKPTEAQDQILLALEDGNIRTRWGDAVPVGYYKSGLAKFGGDSPRWGSDPYYWSDTIINWDEGTTSDPHIENENSSRQSEAKRAGKKLPKLLDELRPLLFLKRHVIKLWPTKGLNTSDTPPLVVTSKTPESPSDRILKIKQEAVTKASKIKAAAKILFEKKRTPETCGLWPKFCRELRKELRVTETTRGYGNSTIENLVRPLLSKKR